MTNSYNNFQKDLAIGKKIERQVLKMVREKYPEAYIVNGYTKSGDIYIPPPEDKWIEVKYDPMSKQTGNIVIEVEFNGKPSALSTTKSYWWVFYTDEEYIITKPDILRAVIKDLPLREFTGRGDSCPKKAYLVKKHQITKSALKIVKAPN